MTNDKQRERLVDLIRSGINKHESTIENYVLPIWEYIADYLLANGVIVPPCKVGDKIYRAVYDWEDCKTVSEWELEKLEVYVDEMGFVDDSDNWIAFDEIGKTVFLSREEAEQALVTDKNVGGKTEEGAE